MPDINKELSKAYNWVSAIVPRTKEVEKVIIREIQTPAMPMSAAGSAFVRIAGLSGAVAVGLGAYGAHAFKTKTEDEQLKHVFDVGNKYHFLHSIALLAVPLCRRPLLTGCLMTTGMLLFSGSCYYHAFTGDTSIRKVTPYGGMLLIAAWISVAI